MEMDKPSAVLRKAAEIISRGWCQGNTHKFDIRGERIASCVYGAVSLAAYDPRICDDSVFYLYKIVKEGVSNWNDAPRRTKVQVIKALEKAAKLAEKDGR